MRACTTKAIALAQIFLILSIGPIGALRDAQVEGIIDNAESFYQVSEDLRQAMEEDMREEQESKANYTETGDYIGEYWADCNQRQADFKRRIEKVKARYDEAKQDGEITATEAAYVLLKARMVAKTVQKAKKNECKWAMDKKAAKKLDKSTFLLLMNELKPSLDCYEEAKAAIAVAKDSDAKTQAQAVINGMSILVSNQTQGCKPAKPMEKKEVEAKQKLEEAENKDVDEEAGKLAYEAGQVERNKLKELKSDLGKAVQVALKKAGEDVKSSSHMQQAETFHRVALEMVESMDSGNGFGEIIGKVIGIILLWIFFLLLCWVVAAIAVFVLGLIMCFFKILITAFLRLFGSQAWNFDYGGCVSFWLGSLGHSSHAGDMHLSFCAMSFMMDITR